jgi:prepilin-type N-terminal cleavage/methylation domain-containing protein
MQKTTNKAFTIIELLIVIAMLGSLATFVIIRLRGAPAAARDTRRKADLKQYQTALELYANDNNNVYPASNSPSRVTSICSLLGISSCPDDSTSSNHYNYITDSAGSIYSLWATLEKPTTTTYFVLCSDGRVGDSTTQPSSSNRCPL